MSYTVEYRMLDGSWRPLLAQGSMPYSEPMEFTTDSEARKEAKARCAYWRVMDGDRHVASQADYRPR